jgi:glycosyltransferase involved in cell wall biosynthesis
MKVLFPFVGDSVGGSHWSAINLYKELNKRPGITPVVVLHTLGGPLSQFLDNYNVPYKLLPLELLAGRTPSLPSIAFSIIRSSYSIFRFIKNNDIDIVHGNDLRINLTWSFPTLLTHSKYVWHQRQKVSESIKWRTIKYLSNYVISISNFVHNSLPVNINSSSKICINNPFDVSNLNEKKSSRDRINSTYNISSSDILIGYVGRLVSWKHVEDILYALSSIISSDCFNKIHFLIAGTGDKEYIKKLETIIDSEKLGNYITMTGFVDNPSLILSSLDLFVASSHNEPFGRVLIESMLQKTSVLASNSGGHIEIVSHGVNGFLYTESSVKSMSKMILKIISDKSNNEKIINTAYNFSIVNYSVVTHADTVISIYKSLVKYK